MSIEATTYKVRAKFLANIELRADTLLFRKIDLKNTLRFVSPKRDCSFQILDSGEVLIIKNGG